MPRTHRPYPPEFRAEAIRLARGSDRSIPAVAADLGVSAEALRHWLRQDDADPGWDVQIDEPVITNVRRAAAAPIYEKTHDLPPGESILIEHAADGFDATLRRRVVGADGAMSVSHPRSRRGRQRFVPNDARDRNDFARMRVLDTGAIC